MFRLTILLCCSVFLVLLIAGEDRGQKRQGLLQPPVLAEAPAVQAPALARQTAAQQASAPRTQTVTVAETLPTLTEAVFVPIQPVRSAAPVIASVEEVETAPQPQPENRIAVVNARSANVRSGPSTSDTIVGRLSNGEQVLLVAEDSGVEGWSLITIEGDGIRGYIATRLLQPLQP